MPKVTPSDAQNEKFISREEKDPRKFCWGGVCSFLYIDVGKKCNEFLTHFLVSGPGRVLDKFHAFF